MPPVSLMSCLACLSVQVAFVPPDAGSGATASFQGIGDLPGGLVESCALALSLDGKVVTGWSSSSRGSRAFRWSDGVLRPLGDDGTHVVPSVGHAVSADGAVIVGLAHSGDTTVGFRHEKGVVTPLLPPVDHPGFADAWGVSRDGQVVVGAVQQSGRSRALLWNQSGVSAMPLVAAEISSFARAISADARMVVGYGEFAQDLMPVVWRNGTGHLLPPLEGYRGGEAHAISDDGRLVVGSCKSRFGIEACSWGDQAVTGLGSISREHEFLSTARSASADGTVIVGSAIDDRDMSQAVVWDRLNGARILHRVLAADFGSELTGWRLHAATGVSGDGRTIVGCGRNPMGEQEGWIARLTADWWCDNAQMLTGPSAAGGEPRLQPRLGRSIGVLRSLFEPQGATVDNTGKIYVADSGRDLVRIFDPDGKLKKTLGSLGTGLRFSAPKDVWIADDEMLYVADTGHDRVQVIDAQGRLRRSWGDVDDSPGRLNRPEGIAFHDGLVYVADTGHDRIMVFERGGHYVRSFGRFGQEPGELNRPSDLGIAADGNVFVADTGNHRVAVFDANGKFMRTWGERGSTPGLFNRPTGIECRENLVYVVDQTNHRVQVFAPDGTLRYVWGPQARRPREAGGRISFPSRIAVGPEHTRAVICEATEDRCQTFAMIGQSAGTILQQSALLDVAPLSAVASAMHVAGDVLALVDDAEGYVLIYRLTADQPVLITKVGAAGFGSGQLGHVEDVWFDESSCRILLADSGKRCLTVYDLNLAGARIAAFTPNLGRLSKTVDFAALQSAGGAPTSSAVRPIAVAHHPDGLTAIVAGGAREVILLNRQFQITARFGGPVGSPGALDQPIDVVFSQDGKTVLVLDLGASCVVAFDLHGTYIRSWGRRGSGPGEFVMPSGIAVAKDGSIYISDRAAHRVQKFDAEGRLVREWGREGIGRGEFFKPRDVALDDVGRVYVNDFGNRRIQVFSADGEFLYVIGSPLVVHPTLVADPN